MDIEKLLEISVENKASDLHIQPGLSPMMRVDGDLIIIKNYPSVLTASTTKRLLYAIMTKAQQQIFEENLVIETTLTYPKIGSFRASIFNQERGIGGVFRLIPKNIPSFEELMLPPILKSFLVLSHGLILVTGATGSGKSTTLAAMIDYINKIRSTHIITIEDPIEFIHQSKKSSITQLQVGRDTLNFAAALRASLRQDPDVILLGEMRDLETIRLALTAAETGHLVMATLHASSAPLTISRIVDIFPSAEKNSVRNLLSETLQAVVCQTLVKKATTGRVAAFEIMLGSPAIRHLIRQDMVTHMETTIQTNGDIGMCTMDQYLQGLVNKRIITAATARSVAINRGSTFKE